jgi:hypothetical protein
MDYGPFLSAAIEVDPGNMAYKGVAIPVGMTGGDEVTMLFDTDLLRWAAGWRGDGVALQGIVYDGPHGLYPRIAGEPDWWTRSAPGASIDGDFSDLRDVPYGPVDPGRMRWMGLFEQRGEVALQYRVGGTLVLEVPGFIEQDGVAIYLRAIEVDGDDDTLSLTLAKAPRESIQSLQSLGLVVTPDPKAPLNLTSRNYGVVLTRSENQALAIGVVERITGDTRIVQQDADVRIILRPASHPGPDRVLVAMAAVTDRAELATFQKALNGLPLPGPMTRFTQPATTGEPGWVPNVSTVGLIDFDPDVGDEAMTITGLSGAPDKDIDLAASPGADMRIVSFDGKVLAGADVLVRDGVVQATLPAGVLPSPIASWTFDEGEGEAMRNDASGRRDLKLEGVTWRRGLRGRCLDFDGTARAIWPGTMDFTRSDLSFAAWITTTADGTIMACTRPSGPWVPFGVTFFIRAGRLAVDVGWVGVITGETRVDDGRWHHVAWTWSKATSEFRLFVDGREDAMGSLPIKEPVKDAVMELGFTAEDYPNPTFFSGFMEGVQVYRQ